MGDRTMAKLANAQNPLLPPFHTEGVLKLANSNFALAKMYSNFENLDPNPRGKMNIIRIPA